MKRILKFFGLAAFLASAAFNLHAQKPECSDLSLIGKYAFAGQGDIYSGLTCGLGICTDTTFDTVGYIVADGKGNLTSARLFDSDNNGVSDTPYLGTYSITNCDQGTLSLTNGSETLNFTIDLDRLQGPNDPEPNVAITAQAEATDRGREESVNLSRTLDPAGCGSTLNFDGMNTAGMQRGYTPAGQKISAVMSMDFFSGGTFSGMEKESVAGVFTASPYSGDYTINYDCTVIAYRNINGTIEAGASIVLGNGIHYLPDPWIWQGESCQPVTSTYESETASPTSASQTYPVNTVC